MAKLVLRDCFVEVDAVDFSDHCSSVTVNLSKEEVEATAFGDEPRKNQERLHGLRDDSFELNFHQDFAAASVDESLWPLWDTEQEFLVRVRPTSALPAPDNPEYSATCILLEYQPLAGDIGSLSETSVTMTAQRSGIARATST